MNRITRRTTKADNDGHLGARNWEPALANLEEDFNKLKPQTCRLVNREGTLAHKAFLESIFGDILPVRIRGSYWWTLGMTIEVIELIGLEQLMLYMYDDPDGLHRLMGFMRDQKLNMLDWMEREQLLSLNNEDDYIGSGSRGYTPELPTTGFKPEQAVRLKDMWALLESQETVGVGPDLFREFIWPYQKPIAERFGLVYYGCCEPLQTRWDVISELSNLRACSVAPLCDEEAIAPRLGSQYIYSRKPNPTLISTDRFDEELIRRDLQKTLQIAKRHNCQPELIMKDVHTLKNEPQRLSRWVALAREAIERYW